MLKKLLHCMMKKVPGKVTDPDLKLQGQLQEEESRAVCVLLQKNRSEDCGDHDRGQREQQPRGHGPGTEDERF